MKKTFIIIASIAIFGIGTTMFVSCSKDENEVLTSNVETKIGDPNYTQYLVDPYHLFWRLRIDVNEYGEKDSIWYCDSLIHMNMDVSDFEICAVSLNKPEDAAAAVLSVNEGRIKKLVLFGDSMIQCLYDKYVFFEDQGVINFDNNCIITDREILSKLKDESNYIPAGEYPIYMEENNFVIIIEE